MRGAPHENSTQPTLYWPYFNCGFQCLATVPLQNTLRVILWYPSTVKDYNWQPYHCGIEYRPEDFPLTFMNHRLQCGEANLWAWALLENGVSSLKKTGHELRTESQEMLKSTAFLPCIVFRLSSGRWLLFLFKRTGSKHQHTYFSAVVYATFLEWSQGLFFFFWRQGLSV